VDAKSATIWLDFRKNHLGESIKMYSKLKKAHKGELSFNTTFLLIFLVGNFAFGFFEMAVRDVIRKTPFQLEIIYFLCALAILYIGYSLYLVCKNAKNQKAVRESFVIAFVIVYVVLCVLTLLLTSAFSPLTYLGSNAYNFLFNGRTGFHLIPTALDYYFSKF
jgi:hypothetical protein